MTRRLRVRGRPGGRDVASARDSILVAAERLATSQ